MTIYPATTKGEYLIPLANIAHADRKRAGRLLKSLGARWVPHSHGWHSTITQANRFETLLSAGYDARKRYVPEVRWYYFKERGRCVTLGRALRVASAVETVEVEW